MLKNILREIVVLILEIEARAVLMKYRPKIIAVTGSVGKTGTKDAIYSVMSGKFYIGKSEKSYNSELGVPLTIIGRSSAWGNFIKWIKNIMEGVFLIILKNHYPKWLVLEVGTNKPGDIPRLAKWLKPDIAVITSLSKIPVHVEFFESPENIYIEKGTLLKYLKKDGIAVVNNDDEYIKSILNMADNKKIITFGMKRGADVMGSNRNIVYRTKNKAKFPYGMSYKIKLGKEIISVRIENTISIGAIYSSLTAACVGSLCDISPKDIELQLAKIEYPTGRGKIVEGINSSTIIDESYNSSPKATEASLFLMDEIETNGKKIVVLGDMTELGKFTIEAHQEIGRQVSLFADMLLVVGQRAKFIADGAIGNKMKKNNIFYYKSSDEVSKELRGKIKKGDLILVKGSQAMRMEKIVEEIMENPKDKKKLLVRQEAEWKER